MDLRISPKKWQLSCCALCQITAADWTPIELLQYEIDKLKREAKMTWNMNNRDSGERACFVITTPDEPNLCANLTVLGFKPIAKFNRRNGYPKGKLTMWFLSW